MSTALTNPPARQTPTSGKSASGIRGLVAVCGIAVGLGFAGCATPAGPIFPAMANAPQWPPPPDAPRITYVGQLESSADLKPARSGFENVGRALFGKNDSHSMLSPMAICSDGHSRLFVADSNAQLVHVFDLENRQYAAWTPGKDHPAFSQPVALAWQPPLTAPANPKDPASAGRLLVSDSVAGEIETFDAAGTYLGPLGAGILQHPVGIAVDAARQRIFVADVKLHQVLVLDYSGKLLNRIGSRGTALGQFNYPTNLALDAAGQLYVSDSLNFRVQLFGVDLKPIRQIGSKGDMPGYFAQPKGIALDAEGHLYVLDGQFENVQIFSPEGQVLMDFGEEGNLPGEFWLPAGIFIEHQSSLAGPVDRIYIADSYNRRIQVFDYKAPAQETQP